MKDFGTIEVIDRATGVSIFRGVPDKEAMGSPLDFEYIAVLMAIRHEGITPITTDGGRRWSIATSDKVWHIYKPEVSR